MPRPNISMALTGTCRFSFYDGSGVSVRSATVKTVNETTAGTSRRKPTGWIPPTGYSFNLRRESKAFGSCIYYVPNGTGDGQIYTGYVGQGTGGRFNSADHFNQCHLESSALNTGSLSNDALIKARLKLKDQDVNLGVAWAERSRTAQLIGDTTIRLARSVKELRRGHVRNAMNLLGISSSRREPRGSNWPRKWLELQYGWKPLASDIFGAAEALSKRNNLSDWRVTAIGKVQREYDVFNEVPAYQGVSGLNVDAHNCTAEVWQGAFVRIDAIPGNAALAALSSLGVTNPLEVAWELAPASFIVDWVYPIGDWVRSLDALLGYSTATTSTSVLVRASWLEKGIDGKHPTNGKWVKNSFQGSKQLVRLTRTVSSGVPLPVPPSFKDGRSLGHMANGLALLASAFGRR